MEEVAEIRKNTSVEIEAFIHGAMCISYSGRCTLSNHMSMRDANRGGCSQSCRWKYDLFDMPFATERNSLTKNGTVEEEFSMSAVDMSMIEHIPDLIENGVDSFKIEGRMSANKNGSMNCGKLRSASLPQAFTTIPQVKMSSCLVRVGKFRNTNLLGKSWRMIRQRKQLRFGNGTTFPLAMKSNFTVPDSITFTKPSKSCIMKTVNPSIVHQIL